MIDKILTKSGSSKIAFVKYSNTTQVLWDFNSKASTSRDIAVQTTSQHFLSKPCNF